jgi:hypothetical protein
MNFKDIKDYNGVCAALGLDPQQLPVVNHLAEDEAKDVINDFMYKRMVRAINLQEDGMVWEPNYYNRELKIEPWLEVACDEQRPGGFGFSNSSSDDWRTGTDAGARRCFKDVPRFRHAFETFPDLFLHQYLIVK